MAAVILQVNPTLKSVTPNQSSSDSMFDGLDRSRLIREPAAASILSVKVDTLRKQRKAGRSPNFVRIGRNVFYRVKDLESFINAHLVAVSHA